MIAPDTIADAAMTPGSVALADTVHLAPMMVVAVWSLLLLAADAFAGAGTRGFQRRLALVGLGIAFACALGQFGTFEYDQGFSVFSGFLVVDHFSLLLDLGVIAIAAGTVAFCGEYARSHRFEYGEQECLVLIAAFGMMILNHAADLVAIFLGIETMSIAIYVLVGARWNSRASAEAALKYFLMGAFASGLLLMGIALLYGATGSTHLEEIRRAIAQVFTQWGAAQPYVDLALHPEGAPVDAVRAAVDKSVVGMAPAALFLPGVLLVLSGILFKISAVPFHMWTPDAYEGAPTPTTGFMAAGVKIGGFAALLKIFVGAFATQRLATAPYGWTSVVAIIALATMTIGNFAAVRQTNVKRLLAYSSIAHVGYILVGVVAAANFYGHAFAIASLRPADQIEWSRLTGDFSIAAVVFYVLTYAVATLGAFACVSWYGANKQEGVTAHEWSGLAQRHPAMALGLTVCLLSLMGMPPTVGFFGKLGLFRAALENDNLILRVLVIAALLNSVVGAYYYLRLIVAMYFRPSPGTEMGTLPGRGARVVVGACAVAVLAMGIGADTAFRRAELAAAGFPFPAGSEARAQWVGKLRDKWDAQDDAAEAAKAGGDAKADATAADTKAVDAKADAKAADAKAGEGKAPDAKAPDAKAEAKADGRTPEQIEVMKAAADRQRKEAIDAATKAAGGDPRAGAAMKARLDAAEAKAAEAKAGDAKAP